MVTVIIMGWDGDSDLQKERSKGKPDIEKGREEEAAGRLAAVQYVKFPLTQPALDALVSSNVAMALVVDHPNYKARTSIEGARLNSLRADFA